MPLYVKGLKEKDMITSIRAEKALIKFISHGDKKGHLSN